MTRNLVLEMGTPSNTSKDALGACAGVVIKRDGPAEEEEQGEFLIEREINRLARVESAVLKTIALGAVRLSIKETVNSPAHSGRVLAQIRRTGELHDLIQKSLSLLQRRLQGKDDLHQLGDEYLYLKDYIRDVCEKDLRDREKIRSALENPLWDFRTVAGIAKETQLEENRVEQVLSDNPELFRKSPVPNTSGRSLYTLASKPIGWRERVAVLQRTLKGPQRIRP